MQITSEFGNLVSALNEVKLISFISKLQAERLVEKSESTRIGSNDYSTGGFVADC